MVSKKYLMSSAQKRIYTIEQVQGKSTTYNIPIAFQLSSPLDLDKLTDSLNKLIARHQVLRTYFQMIDGKFGQIVEEKYWLTVERIEDSVTPLSTIIEEFIRPFEIDRLPLLRVCYCTLATGERYLLFDAHHIIMDGGSMGIFLEELKRVYNGEKLLPIKLQYKDYSAWHRKKDKHLSREFWLEQFSDGLPEFELFYDHMRPKEREYLGDTVSTSLSSEQVSQLNALAEKASTTNYMIFIACFMIFLSKYSGSKDVVIGTTVSGRNHPDIQNLLGMFVNTLPINDTLQPDERFSTYLERIKHKLLGIFDHQDYPLEEIIEDVKAPICENKNPIFDILFNYQSNGEMNTTLGNSVLTEVPRDSQVAKFDLTFNLGSEKNQIELVWEYDVSLFEKSTIERMQKHFVTLLGDILADPTKTLGAYSCLAHNEIEKILTQFNEPDDEVPEGLNIIKHFTAQVEKFPQKVALAGVDQSLTYVELDAESSKIASLIKEKNVGSALVAVIAARDIQTVTAYLGILKAGAAYLPLDPKNPKQRNKEIIEKSKSALLINFSVEEHDPDFSITQLTSADLKESQIIKEDAPAALSKHSLAYVIYTSGTTGEPKGTMIEHKSIIRLVKDPNYVFLDQPNILQTGSLTFDASTFEIWGALLNGGTLYVSDVENLVDPDKLQEKIEHCSIDVMWLTTSLFNQLVSLNAQVFSSLNYLLIGGEKLSAYHVRKFKEVNQQTHLINGYGPTECTTFALTYEIPNAANSTVDMIPIGSPINYTKALVFSNDSLCGIGMPGELYLGGEGLARGYLGNEALTNEKFIEHPLAAGKKLYKTGDLVRWNEDGQIEFLGRIDQQVKIRGFRIELKEIEAHLLDISEISEAAVIASAGESSADKQLIAYVSMTNERSPKQIKEQLRVVLPEYMIPKAIILLDSLPKTKNGKLAVNQLPAQSIDQLHEIKERPETPQQTKVLMIFKEILNLEEIGINEDFYDLGGDSIKAIRIVSKLKEQGYSLTINDILHYRTIKELSNNLKSNKTILIDQGPVTGIVPFTPIQLKFAASELAVPSHFNQSIMLEFPTELLNQGKLEKALQAILSHHDMLRAIYRETQSVQPIEAVDSFKLEHHVFDQECQEVDWLDQTTEIYQMIKEKSNTAQAGLSLKEGKVFKAVVFQFADHALLLLIAHHLVVDTISWKIIIEDLETAYKNLLNDQQIKLPLKTMSYQKWSQALTDYAKSDSLAKECAFWQETADIVEKSQLPIESNTKGEKQLSILSAKLGTEMTARLFDQQNRIPNVYVKEMLITALARTLAGMTRNQEVSILLEGHGREQLTSEIEIDRTVGWFTITYPVGFSIGNSIVEDDIAEVSKSLKAIPNNGIGFGLVKTLVPKLDKSEPMITFNYSGEFEESQQTDQIFTLSPAPQGNEISSQNHFGTPIAVNLVVVDKNLNCNIVYDKGVLSESFANDLERNFLKEIENVIQFLEQKPKLIEDEAVLFVPAGWDESSIKQTIRPSAMQKSFLKNLRKTLVYAPFELQTSDPDKIIRAVNILIQEQPLLRTSYKLVGEDYNLYEHTFDEAFTIPIVDLSLKTEEERWTFLQKVKENMTTGFFDKKSTALHHMLLTKINEDKFVLHLLISHSIWDKYSDAIFCEQLKNQLADISNHRITENTYTQFLPEITDIEKLEGLQNHLLRFKEMKDRTKSSYQANQEYAIRLSTLNLGAKVLNYSENHYWSFIMYLIQIIIRKNHQIDDFQAIPVYVVQDNRKYMPDLFSKAIGSYLDLWPILLERSNTEHVVEVEEQMNQFQQLKIDTQVSLIDEFSKIDNSYMAKEIYSINNQTAFELTAETLAAAKKQIETMTKVDGFEIVINRYADQLVLIYPENIAYADQLESLLQQGCEQLEHKLGGGR
ncbi:amino acid adenylation domain-containing protein [Enterococcus sp. BWT-B8]|uniref:non-ribosomal peptide synthetase n=1 Tax=Enterococcus sp. BWT-B8 TaxID=2885157 RepID=UPI001E5B8746|nr:non-ribosomal peptide synthetase [Enterococcus sp. BWT-B8]MCB5951766.1 amino acid adenylation domain-containing protein [Enterococcus sp. BWT-B8]